jgi:hypothetical protein
MLFLSLACSCGPRAATKRCVYCITRTQCIVLRYVTAKIAPQGDEALYQGLLSNLRIKVDACRLQKHRPLVYDTQVRVVRDVRRMTRRWGWRRHRPGALFLLGP